MEQQTSKCLDELKIEYLSLTEVIKQLEESEDTGIQTVNALQGVIHTVNSADNLIDFDDRVGDFETTMLESELLASTSTLYQKCVEDVKVADFTYDVDKFVENLLLTVNDEEDAESTTQNWLDLVPDANTVINDVPKFSFLYGTFDPTEISRPKEKKERVAKERQAETQKQHIDKRENVVDKEQDDQEGFIMLALQEEYDRNGNKPIGYFDFVIDNQDFSTTVENMFYTSFLIRNGKASFTENEDELPTIEPVSSEVLEEYRKSGGQDSQCIISIDMKDWRALKGRKGIIQRKKESSLNKRKK